MLSTATKNIEFAVRSSTAGEEYRRILWYRKIQILIDISWVKISFTLSFISYAASDMHDLKSLILHIIYLQSQWQMVDYQDSLYWVLGRPISCYIHKADDYNHRNHQDNLCRMGKRLYIADHYVYIH